MEKKNIPPDENQLLIENEELRQRVYEYEETLNSIRNGEIDAIVVSGVDGEKIYSLTSAETKYRIIIEEMNEGAITTSKDGLITYCNTRFAELISEPTETFVGSYFINYLQESEQQVFLDLLQSGLKGKIVGLITYKLKNGHNLELQLSISPIPADIQNGVCILFSDITLLKQQEKELLLFNSRLDQKIVQKTNELTKTNQELKDLHIVSMSMMEDAVEARRALEITNADLHKEIIEHKLAEEALQNSELKFSVAFKASPYAITITNPGDGLFIEVNDSFFTMTGFTPDETYEDSSVGMGLWVDGKDRDSVVNSLLKGGQVKGQEFWFKKKNGEIILGLFSANLISIKNKTYILSSINDITDRKRMEEELRSASLYARSLIEASIDPLLTIGQDGKITDVNNSTEQVTGHIRKELIGTDFSDYFTEPGKAQSGYKQVFQDGSVHDYPLSIRHTSGKITDVLYNATVYRNEAGEIRGVFAAARDITERKQAEEKIENQINELNRFNNTMVDREIKMIELKEEINSYCKKLNLVEKYSIPEDFKRK